MSLEPELPDFHVPIQFRWARADGPRAEAVIDVNQNLWKLRRFEDYVFFTLVDGSCDLFALQLIEMKSLDECCSLVESVITEVIKCPNWVFDEEAMGVSLFIVSQAEVWGFDYPVKIDLEGYISLFIGRNSLSSSSRLEIENVWLGRCDIVRDEKGLLTHSDFNRFFYPDGGVEVLNGLHGDVYHEDWMKIASPGELESFTNLEKLFRWVLIADEGIWRQREGIAVCIKYTMESQFGDADFELCYYDENEEHWLGVEEGGGTPLSSRSIQFCKLIINKTGLRGAGWFLDYTWCDYPFRSVRGVMSEVTSCPTQHEKAEVSVELTKWLLGVGHSKEEVARFLSD